jgi:hypothetical protein
LQPSIVRSVVGGSLAVVLACSACSPAASGVVEHAIGPLGPARSRAADDRLFATSAERFGLATPGTPGAATFRYELPAGWSGRAPTELRAVNLQVGPDPADECTVTVLGGDGGGALANVNRWCGQIGARPWTQAELDAAPRLDVLGAPAIVVLLGEAGAPRAMLGALARDGASSVFVKFSGARATVLAQREAFESFCKSLARSP